MKKRSILAVSIVVVMLTVMFAFGMTSSAAAGEVLKITCNVTAGDGEDMTALFALHSAADWNEIDELGVRFPLAAGDKIEYEIAISKPIAGLGVFDAQENGGWTMMSAYLAEGATDKAGNAITIGSDFSSLALNKWYKGVITPPADFLGKHVSGWYFRLDGKGPVDGNTFDLYVKYVKVVHSDSTETIIMDADTTVKYRAYWVLKQGAGDQTPGVGDMTTALVADPFAAPVSSDPGPQTSDASVVFPLLISAVSAGTLLVIKNRK